ncbi:MAG: rRNA pseudouridine synthase [Reichenbachiella sp.]
MERKKRRPKTSTSKKAETLSFPIRLNKYIANAGICSRRDADALISEGKIKINDKVVTELGRKVEKGDKVKHNGKLIVLQKFAYVLLNKPKAFLTTMDDPQGRPTVMKLVEGSCDERIFPVGRLDRNTTGLLLFSNDGELSQKLTHPKYKIKKIYQVELNKALTSNDANQIADGVKLEDGLVNVDEIVILDESKKNIGIQIHVGKNRIVRRIFESLGYEVTKLDRTMYGNLTKKNLPRGKWRLLTEKEVVLLKNLS